MATRKALLARLARAEDFARTSQAQILFGNPEAIVGFPHQCEARPSGFAQILAAYQETAAGAPAPAHPAAKLVKLGEAEPFRSFDNHHGCVGDVDPHLDDRRRYQHRQVPACE